MRLRLKLTMGLILIAVFTIVGLGIGTQLHVFALADATLGSTSPWPANSDWPGDPSLLDNSGTVHVHYLRKQGVSNGSQPTVELKAYYPSNLTNGEWNGLNLKFTPGNTLNDAHVCNVDASGMTPAQKKQFIRVSLSTGGPAAYNKTYWVSYDNACTQQDHDNAEDTNANNVFYGNYGLPAKPDADPDTNRFVVDVVISYSVEVPQGDNGIRFLVKAPSSKIGPLGSQTGNTSFSVIADWSLKDQNNITATRMVIPFGMACSRTTDASNAKVRIYDADNGFFTHTVKFRVKDMDTGNYVRFSDKGSDNAGPGTFEDGQTTYVPPNGSGNDVKTAWAVMDNFKAGEHYQMEIYGIDTRNTIDVGVPGDPIFGVIDCGWKMKPTSTVKTATTGPAASVTAAQGETVTFEHTATNIGAFDTAADIDITAKWGTRGLITSGNVVTGIIVSSVSPSNPLANQSYKADEFDRNHSRTITTKIIIPSNAVDGAEYCQYLLVNHHSNKDSASISSATACVKVQRTTPPCTGPNCALPRTITISPQVIAGGATETLAPASFDGKVTIGNFPKPEQGGWGYSEMATQLTANQVYGDLVTAGTSPAKTRTVYTCPSGYTPTTTTTSPHNCTKNTVVTIPATKGKDGNYSCPSGYTAKGTGASKTCSTTIVSTVAATGTTQYQYTCADTGVTSAWSASSTPPACKNKYRCPGGATIVGSNATEGWYASAPACNAWKCRYPDATQKNRVKAPLCDYRCSGGDGDPAYNDTRGNTAGSGDLRCYVEPKFTMTCRWDTGATTTETVVYGKSTYCTAGTSKAAGLIGPPGVCATLSVNPLIYSASWQSNPLPGYAYDPVTSSYRQMYAWGWSIGSDTDCSDVVGMPYVKVYGGDVRVGGGVGTTKDQTCETNTNAIIRTYARGDATGSGAQHAAIATGVITQFVSGQYKNRVGSGANPTNAVGSMPKSLSFANTSDTGAYGGSYSGAGIPCAHYLDKLPASANQRTITPTDDPTFTGRPVTAADNGVWHIKGDVFITGDITYAGGIWLNSSQIPLFQMVVEGNIYIASGVKQLDGLYVALPNTLPGESAGGEIFTCASAVRVPINAAFDGRCSKQLVVNGAFATSKAVRFLRDCGSLVRSTAAEPTVYTGGTDAQTCTPGATNHAAEVFNYTPEQWIRGSGGALPSTYDSVSSMPPIL
ncbi:MAG: exported protein of unknown function [Candidatus Saccharibacteria bacterium]|nr:exported protein of unknown function [Candidatus Saccharibacteria bacterium]